MKKLLLVSTAIAGIAMMSSPASAALKMDVGGFFRGYGVYADNNEPAGAANALSQFDFRRDSEIFVTGETALDNGLTVGAHAQLNLGGYTENNLAGNPPPGNGAANTTPLVDEEYAYFSGGWGRFNLGQADGAAYLLQIAAPSADSNVDGLRTRIQALNMTNWKTAVAGRLDIANLSLDYQQADFRDVDRLTYLTPKFNGFQAGVSYAPNSKNNSAAGSSLAGMPLDSTGGVVGAYKDLWEASARWDGEFQGLGVSVGAGYSDSTVDSTQATTKLYSSDFKTWNAGASLAMSGVSLGGEYKDTNNGIDTNGDTKTYDIGLGWDNGPYHVGGSYFNDKLDANVTGTAATVDRYAAGAGYTFGPGMTFRGAVTWGSYSPTGAASTNFTQGTVGTDIEF